MCARHVATVGAGLRQISFAPSGDMFGVAQATGSILLFHDANADGVFAASEVTTYASTGGGNGNHCDVDGAGDFLYAGTSTGVTRWLYDARRATGSKWRSRCQSSMLDQVAGAPEARPGPTR